MNGTRGLRVIGGASLPHEAYLAALCSLDEVGPSRLRWLLSLGEPAEVWERVRSGRLPVPPPRVAPAALRPAWATEAAGIDPARCWARCEQFGVGVVSLGSPGYPPALADDLEPPVVLFHLGDPDRIDAVRVGIVGTRRATGYGIRQAERIGAGLADAGIGVVSGLALGIDAAAHRGAVGARTRPGRAGGSPVAVVAAGLDAPCPRRNRPLADQVIEHGVVLSEVPPGVSAERWRFPVRNRIIAGLCDALVVVESAAVGGSMHTVREAMERDRPVLAVPGPVDSKVSEGTNELLADGALMCRGVDDVLSALGHLVVPPAANAPGPSAATSPDPRPDPTGDAARVLDAVGWRPETVERLASSCGLDFAGISSALSTLETQGWVQRTGGWVERVARPSDHP